MASASMISRSYTPATSTMRSTPSRAAAATPSHSPRGTLDYAARHDPGYDRADLEVGARRQLPCIDIRYLEQAVHDPWDSLVSLELICSDVQLPAAVISLDLLAVELEVGGLEGPKANLNTTN